MKTKMILDEVIDGMRVKLEVIEDAAILHDYGISHQSWRRGAMLRGRFGTERALALIDQRAEQASDRNDHDTARRWRELITAIHALTEDERLIGQRDH
jgi:hypothetical protein